MGIININKQQASQSTQKSPGTSRGLAVPMDGTPSTIPGASSGYMVRLDLSIFDSLTKSAPRTTSKPKPAPRKAPQKKKHWLIRVFESLRWTIGPKY